MECRILSNVYVYYDSYFMLFNIFVKGNSNNIKLGLVASLAVRCLFIFDVVSITIRCICLLSLLFYVIYKFSLSLGLKNIALLDIILSPFSVACRILLPLCLDLTDSFVILIIIKMVFAVFLAIFFDKRSVKELIYICFFVNISSMFSLIFADLFIMHSYDIRMNVNNTVPEHLANKQYDTRPPEWLESERKIDLNDANHLNRLELWYTKSRTTMRHIFIQDIDSTINLLEDRLMDNKSGIEKVTRLNYRLFASTKLLN